ncbi:putative TPR-like repeat domain-containing region [Encephalitozoon hellem]|nr:putative TPR-like repeat domain-containing region [Encephalitozoon hellem]
MNLYDLVKNDCHEEISRLEHPEFNQFRVVAYINLGKFEEALRYAEKDSFERAYALYKLKKYKKALRILKHIDTEGSKVLASQCLYYLGYYNTAYKILSEVKKDDDIIVNLQAMKGLAMLADKNQYVFGNKFQLRKRDELAQFEDLSRHDIKHTEGRVDFIFNLSFESLANEEEFVNFLSRQLEKPEMSGTIVEEQLKNIKGEEVNPDLLLRNQRETFEFNRGAIDKFSNPLHFQQNFQGLGSPESITRGNVSLWIERVYSSNFSIQAEKIPLLSPKMVLLRILTLCKSGSFPSQRLLRKAKEWPESPVKSYLCVFDPMASLSKEFYIRLSKDIMN